VKSAAGRTFDNETDDANAPPRAVISHDYWMRRFQGDPSVVGRTILVDGLRVAITGVAAPGFAGEVVGMKTDIWLPLALRDRLHPNQPFFRDRRMTWLLLIGRPKPGLTPEQVRAQTCPTIKSAILFNAAPTSSRTSRIVESRASAPGARSLDHSRSLAAPLVTLMFRRSLLCMCVTSRTAAARGIAGGARCRCVSQRRQSGAHRATTARREPAARLERRGGTARRAVGNRLLVTMASRVINLGPSARTRVFLTLGLRSCRSSCSGRRAARLARRPRRSTALRAIRIIRRALRPQLIAGQVALSLLLAGASILTRSLRKTESIPLGFDRDHRSSPTSISVRRAMRRSGSQASCARCETASRSPVAAVSYSQNGIFSDRVATDINVPGFVSRRRRTARPPPTLARAATAIGAHLIVGDSTRDEGVDPRTAIVG
jgi:hypothetical protein